MFHARRGRVDFHGFRHCVWSGDSIVIEGRRTVCDCLLAPMMMLFSDERAHSEDWRGGGCSLSTVRVVNNAVGA
jgi:hypothetical protein